MAPAAAAEAAAGLGRDTDEEDDEEEHWEVIAQLTPGAASYVEVPLTGEVSTHEGVLREGPCLGVAASSPRPEVTFSVASGWLLRESSVGPVRCEVLEDLGRSGEVFSAVGLWVDKRGLAAFYRRPEGASPWECSGEIDLRLTGGPPGVVLARRAGGALIESLETEAQEPPEPPKRRMQVHWRATAPVPWFERALRRKELTRLEDALQAGAAADARDARLEGGLHHCARRFWAAGLSALLAARADVNAASVFKRTPLLEATCACDAKALELLIQARAELDFQGGVAWEQRACALVKNKEHRSALHHAARLADVALLRPLLEARAAVDRMDAQGATPLRLAVCAEEHKDCAGAVGLLLAARANPNPPVGARQRVHVTPLHISAARGHADVVEQLLAAGADPNRRVTAPVLSPLMVAAKGKAARFTRVVERLLSARADVFTTTAQGASVLELARLNSAPASTMAVLEAHAAPGAAAWRAAAKHEAAALELPQLVLDTDLGEIVLLLRPDAAPKTVEHVAALVQDGVYDGCCFYRSDIVIQFGLQRPDGSRGVSQRPSLAVNETACGQVLSNCRGAAAVAHWDIPDCGNTELFINLQANEDLDTTAGGYCVFAEVFREGGSMAAVDAVAAAVIKGEKPVIRTAKLA